jgi:hypothetical protein
MAKKKHTINYSIEGIAQSIVRDNPVTKKYGPEDKKRLYAERLKKLDAYPELKKLLSLEHIHGYKVSFAGRVARLALLPPEIVVVDSRIQDMCSLPYWTFYGSGEGSFNRCSGIGAFSCCPPFTLKADKVRERLDRSDIFVAMQTRPGILGTGEPGGQFQMINKLADEIRALLGDDAVVQKFGGGPCFACYPESCECEGKCRAPNLKVPSLEGMGVCVDQLCKDAAFLTGDKDWPIKWIKGFGSPDQTPKQAKGTSGIAVKLPGA